MHNSEKSNKNKKSSIATKIIKRYARVYSSCMRNASTAQNSSSCHLYGSS